MEEVKTIILDGIEYFVAEELILYSNKYYYLVNTNDDKDIIFRKQLIENGEEYLVTLSSVDELARVMQEFTKKFQN